MNTKKVASFFKDARSIWVGILMLITLASWAGDLKWVTKVAYSKDQIVAKIQALNSSIGELQIRMGYSKSPEQKQMFQSLIIFKESQIKNLKEGMKK